jgi:cyclopropane fatty-acyl-phospholipid synthase-like methyltransferase
LIERITTDMFGPLTRGHEARYCLAAGFLRPGDVVVDAACGIAYGASVMCAHGDVTYIGVDKDLSEVVIVEPSVVRLIEADLTTWRPEFDFDVAVGFETIEHLSDYSTYLPSGTEVRIAFSADRSHCRDEPVPCARFRSR